MTEQWRELKETIIEMRDNDGTGTQQEVCKFLANYMEVLEKQMQQPSEDCISREEVQNLISRWLSDYLLDETREALETINYKVGDMPSVTPERPKGKWIDVNGDGGLFECSKCGDKVCCANNNYCPNCGAEMKGGREDAEKSL